MIDVSIDDKGRIEKGRTKPFVTKILKKLQTGKGTDRWQKTTIR